MSLFSSDKFTPSLITVIWTLVALHKFYSGYNTTLYTKFQCDLAGLDFMLCLKNTLITGTAAGILYSKGEIYQYVGDENVIS